MNSGKNVKRYRRALLIPVDTKEKVFPETYPDRWWEKHPAHEEIVESEADSTIIITRFNVFPTLTCHGVIILYL